MSYFKSYPVRSKKLRDSARGRPCTLRLPGCDGGGETTVLAHLPFGGRGIGIKAPDYHAVIACHRCHSVIDRREESTIMAPSMLRNMIRAHAETMQVWIDEGLLSVSGAK